MENPDHARNQLDGRIGYCALLGKSKIIKSDIGNVSCKMAVCAICFPGKTVLIVNGIHRGSTASLVSLDEKSFSVTVNLKDVS